MGKNIEKSPTGPKQFFLSDDAPLLHVPVHTDSDGAKAKHYVATSLREKYLKRKAELDSIAELQD